MTDVGCGVEASTSTGLLPFPRGATGFSPTRASTCSCFGLDLHSGDRLPALATSRSYAAPLLSGVGTGFRSKSCSAAATRPMFWLHARGEFESVESLRGKRVATYPSVAPPHWFHRVLLRKHGLDADRDVEFVPCRDDIIRLGLLRAGDVDAALLSSATSPVAVQRLGLRTLALTGDEVQFVTTGVATFEWTLRDEPELVEAIVQVASTGVGRLSRAARRGDRGAGRHSPGGRGCGGGDVRAPATLSYGRRNRRAQPAAWTRWRTSSASFPVSEPVEPTDLYDFSLLEPVTA